MDIAKLEKDGALAKKIIIGCAIFFALVWALSPKSKPVDNGVVNAKTAAILMLKKNLRDPGSLEIIEASAGKTGENEYFVQIDYRAKNGFGGYSVEKLSLLSDKDGNVLEVY